MGDAVEVERLGKRYGRVIGLAGVTFSVAAGEVVGYLGPNGAGKTTTIRCLMGLLRPTTGSIRLLGHSVPEGLRDVLGEVGYLPGEFGLWPHATGRNCLDFLGRLAPRPPRRRSELCERFELSPDELDRQSRFYSRGMRQKIAIIQAFQHDPDLVVMDEPTEGLDPVLKERFLDLLDEHRAAGRSAVMSSHILSEVEQVADRVVVLRAGAVVREVGRRELAEHVRHCTVRLAAVAEEVSRPELPGAVNVVWSGDTARFDHRGSMAPLLRVLAQHEVVEFLSEPGNLLDMFFEIYGQEAR
jgi:ABC-2 type transport system ATP-binding protein